MMFEPSALDLFGAAANQRVICGALVIAIAVIALAEVARPLRFLNLAIGIFVLWSPWFFSRVSSSVQWIDTLVGVALVALSLPAGFVRESYGTYDGWVLWPLKSRRGPSVKSTRDLHA
jgi:hypothetical protein